MSFPLALKKPAIFLAPMQDITDSGFMQIISEYGACDACISEYFRIHECYEFEKFILEGILNSPKNVLVAAQFIGENEFHLARAISQLKRDYPQIKMLDLNIACPAPKIYRKNVGGGLLRDLKKLDSVIAVMRDNWNDCFSVKMRSGFESDLEFEKLFECVLKHNPDFVTIHARTVKQLYRGQANYDVISKAVEMAGDVPVVANGDIISAQRAKEVLLKTKCAGLMVGRHAVRNPWIFRQIREILAGENIFQPTLSDVRLYIDKLCANVKKEGDRMKHLDSRLKKFLNFIATGVDSEGVFLHKMRQACGIDELLKVCDLLLVENGNAQKPFALSPYENLCARPNHEAELK